MDKYMTKNRNLRPNTSAGFETKTLSKTMIIDKRCKTSLEHKRRHKNGYFIKKS